MTIYWILFAFPALFALLEQDSARDTKRVTFAWIVTGALLAAIIGLRWKTGGDWGNYYTNLVAIEWEGVWTQLHRDLGFGVLSLFARLFPYSIVVVTLVSGIIMAIGLTIFSLAQPRPWLCLTVAIPYLVLVVGMGYIRQGIAISFMMIGLVQLQKGRPLRYTMLVAFGALFHSTAVVMVVIGALIARQNRVITALAGIVVAILGYSLLLAPRTDALLTNYVDAQMDSQGTLIRLAMTALPAALFLAFQRNFELDPVAHKAWRYLSFGALALLALFVILPSSTVVDRMGLYFLPLQAFVYSQLPDAIGRTRQNRQIVAIGVVLLYAAVLFVWLNYASHSRNWVPYRFFPFEDGLCIECGDPHVRDT